MAEPPSNPYIIDAPVGGEQGFAGRTEIFETVERTLRDPEHNSVILYGQRCIGKTSLLLQLERRLPDPPFLTIYYDLADKALVPISQVLYELAVLTANKANITPPPPELFQNNPAAFDRDFLPALYQALGNERRPVYLLDEFNPVDTPERELLETTAVRSIDEYLYGLITTQIYADFVFAAGRRMPEISLVEYSSFKADLTHFVSVLPREQAYALIKQEGVAGAPKYDDLAVERILDITRGHPYLIQLVCHHLYQRASQRQPQNPRISAADVEAIIPLVIERDEQVLPAIWGSIPPAERITLAAIAGQIQREGQFVSQAELDQSLRQADIPPDAPGLSQSPQNLTAWQMLEPKEKGYTFFIKLMQWWVARKKPLAQVRQEELPRLVPAQPQLNGDKPKPQKERRRLWLALILAAILLPLLCLWLLWQYGAVGPNRAGTATGVAQLAATRIAATVNAVASATAAAEAAQTSAPEATASSPPAQNGGTAIGPAEATATAAAQQPTPAQESPTPAPTSQLSGQIRVVGPDSVQPVLQALADSFTASHPGVEIEIETGNSQAGLEAVQQGSADLSIISRQLTEAEVAQLGVTQLRPLAQTDVIAIIGHTLTPVDNLTSAQVQSIFTGQITNWNEISNVDAPIVVVSPDTNAETRAVFEQILLGGSAPVSPTTELASHQAVRNQVATQPYAIGYIPLSLAGIAPELSPDSQSWAVLDAGLLEIKIISLDGVEPNRQNAASGAYPLVRPLNLLTKESPGEPVQSWLEFIAGPEGQQIIEQAGQPSSP